MAEDTKLRIELKSICRRLRSSAKAAELDKDPRRETILLQVLADLQAAMEDRDISGTSNL